MPRVHDVAPGERLGRVVGGAASCPAARASAAGSSVRTRTVPVHPLQHAAEQPVRQVGVVVARGTAGRRACRRSRRRAGSARSPPAARSHQSPSGSRCRPAGVAEQLAQGERADRRCRAGAASSGSSRAEPPSSRSRSTSAAVIVLVIEPIRYWGSASGAGVLAGGGRRADQRAVADDAERPATAYARRPGPGRRASSTRRTVSGSSDHGSVHSAVGRWRRSGIDGVPTELTDLARGAAARARDVSRSGGGRRPLDRAGRRCWRSPRSSRRRCF